MNFAEYVESCNKPEKRILKALSKVDEVDATELCKLANQNPKNLSRDIKRLIQEGIVKMRTVSPKHVRQTFKYFKLASKEGIENIEITEIKPKKQANGTKKTKKETVRIIKENVNVDEIKKQVLDDLKDELLNNSDMLKAKSEIIKIIMKLPIRKVDKEALGLAHMTSNQVREYVIDNLDIMTIFKL